MGYTIERTKKDGSNSFTAMYRDIRGKARSAGTYATEKLADKAWMTAEIGLAAGRIGDPKRGKQTLQHYVEVEWFPLHVIEASTRQGYTYLLDAYILPELGTMRIVEILAWHVRGWVLDLQTRYDLNPPTIKKCKVVLDAILTTALNDQVTMLHAGKGVKTPPVATKPRRIITAAQYDRIHANLGDETIKLLVETDIETGLRWGELTELRVKDLDLESSVLTIARGVVYLTGKTEVDGPRFLVKNYPKDKQWRQVKIPRHLVDKIKGHIDQYGLGAEDLLFQLRVAAGSRRRLIPEVLPDPETLGLTEPNEQGRQYQHGTLTAYQTGKCRCRHCKDAIGSYRAGRRASGIDLPRKPRSVRTDGHIPGEWFRTHVWNPALEKAKIGFRVTPHGLRHAHASWLLAGGADLQVVKERLGHGSLNTTGLYLHTLPGAGDAALKAMESYRASASAPDAAVVAAAAAKKKAKKRKGKKKAQGELAELKVMMAQMKDAMEAMRPGA